MVIISMSFRCRYVDVIMLIHYKGDMKKEGIFHARVLAFQYIFALAGRRSILMTRPDIAEAFVKRASSELVLHSTPEVSALGSALMAELAQEPRLCASAIKNGGLDALLRASLARYGLF